MLARQFVDFYLRQVSAPVDAAFVLDTLNWVQNKIAGMDTEWLRILPDPYFTTTAATYAYTANDVCRIAESATPGDLVGDVRIIREIYSRAYCGSTLSLSRRYWSDRFMPDAKGGRYLSPITCPGSMVPGSDDCRVFWDLDTDPGDQTTQYNAVAYRWPKQLTSPEIALEVPEDFCRDLIYQAVKFIIEDCEYGAAQLPATMEEKIMKRFKTKFSANTTFGRLQNAPPLNC